MGNKTDDKKISIWWPRIIFLLWIGIAVVSHFSSFTLTMTHALGIIFVTGVLPYAVVRIVNTRSKE